MRPAQLTPENGRIGGRGFPRKACFNEAGAINAGKHAEAAIVEVQERSLQ